METKEWTFIDKGEWPLRGPWDQEPDKVQWQDKETGLPCLAVRNRGHWCGYVGVTGEHPLFGVSYSECKEKCGEDWCEHRPASFLSVHGGLTFSDFCQPHEKEHGICHIVGEGEDDKVWWFGFDCAHAGDYSPPKDEWEAELFRKYPTSAEEDYRDLEYVKEQTRELAKQLVGVGEIKV